MSDTVAVDARGVLAPGDVGSEGVRQINRRQLLTGLAFLGVGAAGATVVTSAVDAVNGPPSPAIPPPPARSRIALRGESVRIEPLGAVPGMLPPVDGPRGARGSLVDDVGKAGRFEITPMPGTAGVLELHTFELVDGTLLGMGSAARGTGAFAVVGGTGRYHGASGSYTARLADGHTAPEAEFLFDLTLGA